MSRIKLAKVAGLKIADLVKKLKKRKYAKDSKKNIERARGVKTNKSVKAYNIRARDAETKIIPVKRQSQKGSSFQTHRIRTKMGRAAARSEERGKLPSPMPTLERLFKKDVQGGKLEDYRLTRMYLKNKLSDVAKKKFKGGMMNKRKLKKLVKKKGLPMPLMTKPKFKFKDAGKFPYVKKLTGGQAKLDKNKNNRIDAEDFAMLRKEKSKKKPMKAALGAIAMGALAAKMLKGKKKKATKMPGAAGVLGGGVLPGMSVADIVQKKLQGKMGGGMMKRYTKGGGADTGKRKIKDKDRPSMRDKELAGDIEGSIAPYKVKKKMGGGIMKVPGGYAKEGSGRISDKSLKGKSPQQKFREIEKMREGNPKQGFQPKMRKKMGGGMMMKPMGYKSGKSIKVKCKLGRNKPTKMY